MYQDNWVPVQGEMLHCSYEVGNTHTPYAVKVMKAGMIVGHLPVPSRSKIQQSQSCTLHAMLSEITYNGPLATCSYNAYLTLQQQSINGRIPANSKTCFLPRAHLVNRPIALTAS